MPEHIGLIVEGAPAGSTQPVEVASLGDDRFEIQYSPGFVEGIAAGDKILVTDYELGLFQVEERGGNVAIKLATDSEVAQFLDHVDSILSRLRGRRDGAIGRAAVWTIPVSAGFEAIERAMEEIQRDIPESQWWYGNVYDDQGKPLNWWT